MSREERIENDTIRGIIEDENRVDNPYANLETLVEKLNILKPHLAALAKKDKFTSYWKLKDDVGIHTSRQGRVLGVLGWHEDEIGEPPLPALVTNSDENMPSNGYFIMVEKATGLQDDIPASKSARKSLWLDHVERVRNQWRECPE